MTSFLLEYLPILFFVFIALGIAIGMTTLSFIIGPSKPDSEKLSAYECGFDAFDDARGRFDVRFYLVAILFIIFDLEVAFLFPWAITLNVIGFFGDKTKDKNKAPKEKIRETNKKNNIGIYSCIIM